MEEDKPKTIETEELLNLDVDIIDDPDVEYCPCGEYLSDEDVATILDAIIKDEWVTRTPEEMIEHTRNLFKNTSGESNESK